MSRHPVGLNPAERAVVRVWTLRVYGVCAAIIVAVLLAPLLFGGLAGVRHAGQGTPTIEGMLRK